MLNIKAMRSVCDCFKRYKKECMIDYVPQFVIITNGTMLSQPIIDFIRDNISFVTAGICDQALVQIAYAIGKAEPVGFYINTEGTSHVKMSDAEIALKVKELVDLRPYFIVKRFGLTNPIFEETASYGHFG